MFLQMNKLATSLFTNCHAHALLLYRGFLRGFLREFPPQASLLLVASYIAIRNYNILYASFHFVIVG